MESLELITSNDTFYSDCRAYFAALHKQGRTDDSFEDEFYYTMPAISEKYR
jgi:hypothetical protein